MSKKDYDDGAKMGIKLAEEIVNRDTRAIEYLSEQVGKLPRSLQNIKDLVEELNSDVEDIQVEKIFGIVKMVDSQNLEYEEKVLLLRVLSHISVKYGSNENQKKFCSRLRSYLKVNANDVLTSNFDGSCIAEVIDSISVQKMMYQTVKEYLYLANNTNDYEANYDQELNWFSRAVDREIAETLIEIKVCLFGVEGLYEQFGAEDDKRNDVSYLEIPEKKFVEISKECATIFFQSKDSRKNNLYCESASYVLYAENDSIVYLDKKTAVKSVMLEKVEHASDMFKLKQISAYQDMVFYVLENEVYFFDLSVKQGGHVVSIEEKYNDKGEKYIVQNIRLAGNKFIYGNKVISIYDLKTGVKNNISISDHEMLGMYHKYTVLGDYLYFVDWNLMERKEDAFCLFSYRIVRYGFMSGTVTDLSDIILEADIFKNSVDIIEIGSYDKYIYVIMRLAKSGELRSDVGEFICTYMDVSQEKEKCHTVKITKMAKEVLKNIQVSQKYVHQLSSYRNHLVYIDKDYSIISWDYLENKKKRLVSKYGKDSKIGLSDISMEMRAVRMGGLDVYDRYRNKSPKEYIMMGTWIGYDMNGFNVESIEEA